MTWLSAWVHSRCEAALRVVSVGSRTLRCSWRCAPQEPSTWSYLRTNFQGCAPARRCEARLAIARGRNGQGPGVLAARWGGGAGVAFCPKQGFAQREQSPTQRRRLLPDARFRPRSSPAPSARRSSVAPRRGLPTSLASSTGACAVHRAVPGFSSHLGTFYFEAYVSSAALSSMTVPATAVPEAAPRGRVLPALGRAVLQGHLLLRSLGLGRLRRPRVRPRCPRCPRERHHVSPPPGRRSAAPEGRRGPPSAWGPPSGRRRSAAVQRRRLLLGAARAAWWRPYMYERFLCSILIFCRAYAAPFMYTTHECSSRGTSLCWQALE
jgi:hypothetical protein